MSLPLLSHRERQDLSEWHQPVMDLSNLGMSVDATVLPMLGDSPTYPLPRVAYGWVPASHTHAPPLAQLSRGLGKHSEEPLWARRLARPSGAGKPWEARAGWVSVPPKAHTGHRPQSSMPSVGPAFCLIPAHITGCLAENRHHEGSPIVTAGRGTVFTPPGPGISVGHGPIVWSAT